MQLLLLCGGLGTRLKSITGDLPKPLVPIAGRTVLDRQLDVLERNGISEVVLIAGFGASRFERHLAKHPRPFPVRVLVEEGPHGTAGTVCSNLEKFEDRFFVLYGDVVFDIDLKRILDFHLSRESDATLFLHPNDHPEDSDLVDVDTTGSIRGFLPSPHPKGLLYRNLVNAGLYLLESKCLKTAAFPPSAKLDFVKDVFPFLLAKGARLDGYESREYIKDMGTSDRYAKVAADLKSGKVEGFALRHSLPAVFFDRDGTLSRSLDYVRTPEQMDLFADVPEAVARLNRAGLLVVVVSNQPVVARGECSGEMLGNIHRKLETLLGDAKAYLDRIYYCPHHPDGGFPGEIKELKIDCPCRKPKPGLFEQAVRELNIDLDHSWVVGDTTVDVKSAKNIGAKSILLLTGHGGRDGKFAVKPDFELDNVLDAACFIIERTKGIK